MPNCRFRSSGFTLLELMIVLALIAFLTAMVWPSLRRPMLRSVSQQAARRLATDLSTARLNAIDAQRIMAFRYELGGGRYLVVPADRMADATESFTASSSYSGLPSDSDTAANADATDQASTILRDNTSDETGREPVPDEQLEIHGQLDEDVAFQDPNQAADNDIPADSTMGKLLRQEMEETEEVKPLVQDRNEEISWSPPILIYPTGRTDNAKLVLRGPDGYWVNVTLRRLDRCRAGRAAHARRADNEHAER